MLDEVRGLSEAEAGDLLQREGYNESPAGSRRRAIAILKEIVCDPIFVLLAASGLVYLFLGDLEESLMLLGFVFFIAGISLYQENKTERALEGLRDLSSPRATVIRGGERKRIPGREVVRGDVVVLSEGDRVPADGFVLWCSALSADESLLTGESAAVPKTAGDAPRAVPPPGGDGLPFVYCGTLIVAGHGIMLVMRTGTHTEIGKIGKALRSLPEERTPLQKETDALVRVLAVGGVALSVLAVLGYGWTRGQWLNALLAGITLAMAILPNELPVVLVIFLALGAWRISKKRVLTRRVPAVETLGSASVLCVDKTGTLTKNQMEVRKIAASGGVYEANDHGGPSLPEEFHQVIEYAMLACRPDPFDPIDRALKRFGERHLINTEHVHTDWNLVREYPLSQSLLALSHVWQYSDRSEFVIAAKGAPEAIADLCHMEPHTTEKLLVQVDALAEEGLRVLGVARSAFAAPPLPGQQHDFPFEFAGLVAVADPVRPGVWNAVDECHAAGIRVVMITGDYPATAMSVARAIGLRRAEVCLTGPELARCSDRELSSRIDEINVFARMVPEQKLRLVQALKAKGAVTAMTGDGVNDAPALRAAAIGIAMGGRGTDVARESAGLVLLDDDFTSIVTAVRLGRRIFDNLKKAMAYLLAIHVPIAGLSLLPVLLDWPLVLLPVHIAFLHLVIDPACSIVFEAEPPEAGVMQRPPRDLHTPLFGRRPVALSLLQGAGVLFIIAVIFAAAFYGGYGELKARAMAFTTLMAANVSLILTNRTWSSTIWSSLASRNAALWWVVGGASGFTTLVLYVPFLRELFRVALLHPSELLICLGAGAVSIIWFELLKAIRRARHREQLIVG